MKYLLILNLLLINSTCSGMAWLKTLKKKVGATFSSIDENNENKVHGLSEELTATHASLEQGQKRLQNERLLLYQYRQKSNINGVVSPLLAAGIFKFNANQSHPAGDAYFNMATWFCLGVSATSLYNFCTTPLPTQTIEHKK